MKLENYKIGTRLGAAFALLLVMLVGIALLGASRLAAMQHRMQDIIEINVAEATLATTMRATVSDRMIALRNIVLLEAEAEMQPEVARLARQGTIYADTEAQLHAIFSHAGSNRGDERAALDQATAAARDAEAIMAKVVKLGLANDNQEATSVLLKELRPVQQRWHTALTGLADIETSRNLQAVQDARADYRQAWLAMLVVTLSAVAFGVLLAWAITRGITVPIRSAVTIAQNVAAGDLTSKVVIQGKDETADLLQALHDMNGNLSRIVQSVRDGATTITAASTQIASGNMDLSSRTEDQATSLEETASAMEEITSTVRQNADNAQQANTLAGAASEVALRGGKVVEQVVDTMQSISQSSKKIAEIISVIDGIAFQTNILALNAAVEAARAGEQGRGFAVVASEVRNLAHRSASAAKEIKTLIDDSVYQVNAGSALAGQAGSTMREVVGSVQRVTAIVAEISQASQEQSGGIAQINQAIAGMDNATQQNAALVEEAAAAAGSLREQAEALVREVGFFTSGHDLPAAGKAPGRLLARQHLRLAGTRTAQESAVPAH